MMVQAITVYPGALGKDHVLASLASLLASRKEINSNTQQAFIFLILVLAQLFMLTDTD